MTVQDPNYNATNTSEELSLKEFVLTFRDWCRYLRSRKLIILTFLLIGAILGFCYAFYKKPEYVATSNFVLEEGDKGSMGQYAGLASMAGIDLGGGGGLFQGDNIIELYKSRTMVQKALLSKVENNYGKELLIDRFIQFNKLKDKNKNLITFGEIKNRPFTRFQDSVLGVVVQEINKKYLSVSKPDKKLSIIQVDVKSSDEVFSKSFNNRIVENVNEFYVNTKTKKSLQNVQILQQKADSVRAVMNSSIFAAAAVGDATPNLNPTKQVQRAAPIQRSQFSAETNKMILGELVKNLELSKISLRKETPLIQIIDSPIFPLVKNQVGVVFGVILGALISFFICVCSLLVTKGIREWLN